MRKDAQTQRGLTKITGKNPFLDFLFLSQKQILVIQLENPILDFPKEMHPEFDKATPEIKHPNEIKLTSVQAKFFDKNKQSKLQVSFNSNHATVSVIKTPVPTLSR